MTKSIAAAIDRVQDLADAITTIRLVPAFPTEQIGATPAAMVYMGAGEWRCQADRKQWVGDIVWEILVPRSNLPMAFHLLTDYAEDVANALEGDIAPPLNDTVDQLMFPIRQAAPVMVNVAGVDYVSVTWTITVDIWTEIT